MTMPHRGAVLLACLLAMAASVSATGCTAGYFQMDLITADAPTDELAKCLSSIKINLNSGCDVTLTSLAAGGSFVPAMWTSSGASALAYKQYKECPADGSPVTSTGTVTDDITTAIENHIYGSDKPTTLTSLDFNSGLVTIVRASGNFTYVITESTIVAGDVDAGAVVSDGTGVTNKFTGDLSPTCGTGRYGVVVGDDVTSPTIKLCPLCPAGTSGDGFGCTACDAGQQSDVGGSCTDCGTGTYANGGNSDCLPCPAGTYSASTKTQQCTQCPSDTYAWIPGSKACYRCSSGRPHCVVGSEDGSGTDCTFSAASSPGSQLLGAGAVTGALAGDYAVPAVGQCSAWSTTMKLSVNVLGDCSMMISPISDKSCAEPGASGYDYSSLQIRAYYKGTKEISTLLPANQTGATAFMMSIVNDAGTLDLSFYAATSEPAKASAAAAVTAATATVTNAGGSVASTTPVSCPAGTYTPLSTTQCVACPVGYYCPDGTKRPACDAGTANPYLGGINSGYCADCQSNATNPYTSLAAADYCTVPWSNTSCTVDGTEWDASSNQCVPCRAGTFRTAGDANPQCQDCPAGKYSAAGAASCSVCPVGQYGPSAGLADQSDVTGLNCLACPVGSLALSGSQTAASIATLTDTATFCDACPEGYYANTADPTQPCVACAKHTYRTGDATPENNVCKMTPAGYKLDLNLGATTISQCPAGTFSFINNSTGTPTRIPSADATACLSCADSTYGGSNLYAPRAGMSSCLPCKGGSVPNVGTTNCTACGAGTYRSFYTASGSCTTCDAGSEAGPSNHQACTTCRPGYYKAGDGATGATAAAKDYCVACDKNWYMPTLGATVCLTCPKGYETDDTGNSECAPCSIGYYNPASAGQDCQPAPAGSFVNQAGAYFTTPCPIGTFNNETGMDSCLPCAPGQYANTLGSKTCKTCPAGTFSLGQASTCRACSAGYFALAGSSECSPCKPGFYANSTRAGTCALCPKGNQCPTIAVSKPVPCPKGYYSNKDGSKTCAPCPVNYYSNATGQTQCTPCGVGTNTRGLQGQTKCQAARISTLRRMA